MSRSKRVIGLGLLGVSVAILLSGCVDIGSLIPLPDAQRYQYVNAMKDDLDYTSAGEVVTERYDTGDGVFSPSFFRAEIEGQTAFDELTNRIQNISGVKCYALVVTETCCNVERVVVKISRDTAEDQTIILRITDSLNGREYKQ